jgi:tripartite-type tricarboxylate transporter receptor subunit TctC
MGDGYPNPGDPCRRLGEGALTADYLDDSAIVVGCAGAEGEAAAKALAAATGGQVLARVEGVTMITIPQGDANVGMNPASETQPKGE